LRTAYYHKTLICPVCKREFKAARSTAKYCSDGCRWTAKRDREVLTERTWKVVKLIAEISRTQEGKSFKGVQFRRIQLELDEAIRVNDGNKASGL